MQLMRLGGGLLVLGLAVATIAGGSALAERRTEVTAQVVSPTTSPSATPASAVRASVTREQAIALVRGLGEVVRADRVEARLMPWSEFVAAGRGVDRTGGPSHGAGLPTNVWAIAVAGDTYATDWDAPFGTPQQHFTWSLWGVDPFQFRIVSLKVGTDGHWPPGFDALSDHVALAPTPAPTAPAPIRLETVLSGVHPVDAIHDLAAADPEALHLWAVVGGHADPVRPIPAALMRSDDGGRTWRTVPNDPTGGSGPDHVAASGSVVLVSDLGSDTADSGRTSTGGLYLSRDGGSSWTQVSTDAVRTVRVISARGTQWFLAEHFWVSNGAATGPSRIFASTDGATWRQIGEVPGPAAFGMLDVPLVSFSTNVPGDGLFRIEGTDLASLRLAPVPGSQQAWSMLTSASDLWAFNACCSPSARVSSDGGRTWRDANAGLAGRIAGLFVLNQTVYAIGDGAYFWTGTEWRPASIQTGKAAAVFQLDSVVFVQDLPGSLWRSSR